MAFLPSDLANLILWHEASDGVHLDSSGNVRQWDDLSGNARHSTQSVAGQRPAYEQGPRPAVIFESDRTTNLELSTAFTGGITPTAFTFLGIVDITEATRQMLFTPNSNAAGTVFVDGFEGRLSAWTNFGEVNTTLRQRGGPCLVGIRGGASAWTMYLNQESYTVASAITGGGAGNSGSNKLRLGAWLSTGNPSNARMEGVFVWTRALTDAEMLRMMDYAEERFGVVRTPRVVVGFAGTSTMWGASANRGLTIPRRVARAGLLARARYANWGESNATITSLTSSAPNRLDPMLVSGVPSVLVAQLGSNDLYGTDDSAATVYARLLSYCQDRKDAGWERIMVAPIQPRSDDTQGTVDFSVRRADYNTLLREGAGLGVEYDVAIDWSADPVLERTGIQTDLNFYNADTIHWEDPGFERATAYYIAALRDAIDTQTVTPELWRSDMRAVIDDEIAMWGRPVLLRLGEQEAWSTQRATRAWRWRELLVNAVRIDDAERRGLGAADGPPERLRGFMVRAADVLAGGRKPRAGDEVVDFGEVLRVQAVSEESGGEALRLACARVR